MVGNWRARLKLQTVKILPLFPLSSLPPSLSLSLTNTYAHIHAHALWMSDRMCVRVCDVLARHLLSFRRGLPASEPTVALEVEQKQNEK